MPGSAWHLTGCRSAEAHSHLLTLHKQVALPFGTFEEVLADAVNAPVRAELEGLMANMDTGRLTSARALVKRLKCPEPLKSQLADRMREAGLPFPGDAGEERWDAAWRAITGVWASKWNERAFLACRKAGLKHADLNMAVLCQQVRPFVQCVLLKVLERRALFFSGGLQLLLRAKPAPCRSPR